MATTTASASEIHAWRNAGLTVVVSGSREHFRTMGGIDEATVPVLITAPAERLKERLLKRGREDASATAERLQRGVTCDLDVAGVVTITNDGALDEAAAGLRQAARHTSALTRRPPPSLKRASTTKGRSGRGLTEDAEVVDRQRTVGETAEALAQQSGHRRAFGRVGQARR